MGNSKEMSNIVRLKYHFTYQTVNLINGKTYVGRHSTNNLNDNYLGSGTLLKRAILKYGKDNFKMEPLAFFDTYLESVEEEEFIVNLEWCKLKDNYNIIKGGYNPVMYGEQNPSWKGGISKRKHKERESRVLNRKNKKRLKAKKKLFRKNFEKEIRDKKILNKGYIKEQKSKKSLWVQDVSFMSIRDCARILKISQQTVQYRLKSSNFPEWVLGEYDSRYTDYSSIKIDIDCRKPVIKMTLNGDIVGVYESIKEASLNNNIPETSIGECCNGAIRKGYKRRTSGGFLWKFKNKKDTAGDRRARSKKKK